LALAIYALLMVFQVLNPIIHLKYLLIVFSLFFTFLSLGLFTYRKKVNNFLYFIYIVLLVLPVFTPLLGLISADAYTQYWKLFAGGMIFQIGTGIYALSGGFVNDGIVSSLKALSILNYSLFLFLAVILFFDITLLMQGVVFSIVGGIVTLLSLLIIALRKPPISL
jgi:hypothetical protein